LPEAGEEARMTTIAVLALLLSMQAGIPKQPAKDLFMHSLQVPGVEVRFVDYHWHPDLFDAFEKGANAPEAKRNWVVARVVLNDRLLTIGGTKVAVGNYALALWPNLDGKGLAIEIRRVDMREVYPNLNALAPAPRGETVYKTNVTFDKASPTVERLDMTLTDAAGKVPLTIIWGDRRLVLTFER
jgi:hypothetical protein